VKDEKASFVVKLEIADIRSTAMTAVCRRWNLGARSNEPD
jgi:hypothetical protein